MRRGHCRWLRWRGCFDSGALRFPLVGHATGVQARVLIDHGGVGFPVGAFSGWRSGLESQTRPDGILVLRANYDPLAARRQATANAAIHGGPPTSCVAWAAVRRGAFSAPIERFGPSASVFDRLGGLPCAVGAGAGFGRGLDLGIRFRRGRTASFACRFNGRTCVRLLRIRTCRVPPILAASTPAIRLLNALTSPAILPMPASI